VDVGTSGAVQPADSENAHASRLPSGLRIGIYATFFLSGATGLVLEVLWSREFVTVFGNSSYAISVVLCAFMAGMGIGSWLGGRLADRFRERLRLYGAAQAGVAAWALLVPFLTAALRRAAPQLSVLVSDSLLVVTLARFVLSFAALLVPCVLMGATLPLLSRFCADSRQVIGGRIGLLYGVNTVGAAAGCFAAAFWMIPALGLSLTNLIAAGGALAAAAAAFRLSRLAQPAATSQVAEPLPVRPSDEPGLPRAEARPWLLPMVALLVGLSGMACEVLWMRYLAFLNNSAYAFPTVLGIYLLGLGLGSLAYRLLLARVRRPVLALSIVEMLLGLTVLLGFSVSGALYASRFQTGLRLSLTRMTILTALVPTLLMGAAFPLLCAAFARGVQTVGRKVGIIAASNTVGSIVGSALPVFVLIPALGVQRSLQVVALLYMATGLALLWLLHPPRRVMMAAGATAAAVIVVFAAALPNDVCRRVFLATDRSLGRHNDILFFHEGRTGTAIVTRDKVTEQKNIYINGTQEVPTSYFAMSCFKLLGGLGPLLHPQPNDVLMICFGGGIAAGATVQYPEVQSLEIVDLEDSVVRAARLLARENNNLLDNPKAHVVIDDGRNFIFAARRKWPVIVSDSTHPKASDSWVLYTQEFYRTAQNHLTDDGLFVQWLPLHNLTLAEYKIIVRTFQSVFPHTSVWVAYGVEEEGYLANYSFLVATARPLEADVQVLRNRLSDPAVAADLKPYGLDTPAGILETFIATGDELRQWVGDGPVNTDDLPYTQYVTKYSRHRQFRLTDLSALMRSVAPHLTNADADLKQELALRVETNRLAFAGKVAAALAKLPGDPKLTRCLENDRSAAQYFRRVAAHYPKDTAALVWLAEEAAARPGGGDVAEQLYQEALRLGPDPQSHVGYGVLLASRGDAAGAAEHYMQALRLDANNVQAHVNLGILLAAQGQVDAAIAHYRQALRADPRSAPAHSSLGNALLLRGDTAGAVAELRRAVKVNPDFAAGHYNLGNAYMSTGELRLAADCYRRALDLEPYLVPARVNLGIALMRKGQLDNARSELSEALRIDPEHAAARQAWALVHAKPEKKPGPADDH